MVKVYSLNRYKTYKLTEKELERKITGHKSIRDPVVAYAMLRHIRCLQKNLNSLRDSAIVFSDE